MFVVHGQERTLDDIDERMANETRSTLSGVLAHGQLFFVPVLAAHRLDSCGASVAIPNLSALSPTGSVCGGEVKRNAARAVGRPTEDRRRRNGV